MIIIFESFVIYIRAEDVPRTLVWNDTDILNIKN